MTEVRHEVAECLPHRDAMVLLDEIEAWDASSVKSALTIRKSTLFLEEEGVPAHIGIEYMAQACALFAGIEAREAGLPVRIGFLLGTRNFEIERPWFRLGERLEVSASLVYRDAQMATFDTAITVAGVTAARARLNVYQPDEIALDRSP